MPAIIFAFLIGAAIGSTKTDKPAPNWSELKKPARIYIKNGVVHERWINEDNHRR